MSWISWERTFPKIQLISLMKVHSIVTVRDAKHTNFVEFRNFKIIYRR